MSNIGKYAFTILACIVLAIGLATFIEKFKGTAFINYWIYGSYRFIGLWAILTILSFIYIIRQKAYLAKSSFLLHCSLALILIGACITHFSSQNGYIHLKKEVKTNPFIKQKQGKKELPFYIELTSFDIQYYPGTNAPSDYISCFKIHPINSSDCINGEASMNKIFKYNGYRFYQTSFDKDLNGSKLSINYDPFGIPVTYCGYFLLFGSMLLILFDKNSRFRKLLKNPILKKTGFCVVFVIISFFTHANQSQTLSKEHITLSEQQAKAFGKIWINYNNRIAPLQTFAYDFTQKITGKTYYKYANAEQVLSGWLFFPEQWQHVQLFEINNADLCKVLNINGNKASFVDFFHVNGDYKLAPYYNEMYLSGKQSVFIKEAVMFDEKIQLINMLHQGTLLKVFPTNNDKNTIWISQISPIPNGTPAKYAAFIRTFFSDYYLAITQNNNENASLLINNLISYQKKIIAHNCPPAQKRDMELFYNNSSPFSWLFMLNLTLGILALIMYFLEILKNKSYKLFSKLKLLFLIIAFIVLSFFFILRCYICGYLALSNGFETMIFTAWCALLAALVFFKYSALLSVFGLLISGVCLLVAHLGNLNPQITSLAPVLSSPLLSIHVSLIMLSYALSAFLMLNSLFYSIYIITIKNITSQTIATLKKITLFNRIILYPCAFFLGAGIFIGAIWANVSWGRYWGWDPKEVWALITFIIISFTFHTKTLRMFNNAFFLHCYSFLIFASVLMTYFGVNYFFSGLHSYSGNGNTSFNVLIIGISIAILVIIIVWSKFKYNKLLLTKSN